MWHLLQPPGLTQNSWSFQQARASRPKPWETHEPPKRDETQPASSCTPGPSGKGYTRRSRWTGRDGREWAGGGGKQEACAAHNGRPTQAALSQRTPQLTHGAGQHSCSTPSSPPGALQPGSAMPRCGSVLSQLQGACRISRCHIPVGQLPKEIPSQERVMQPFPEAPRIQDFLHHLISQQALLTPSPQVAFPGTAWERQEGRLCLYCNPGHLLRPPRVPGNWVSPSKKELGQHRSSPVSRDPEDQGGSLVPGDRERRKELPAAPGNTWHGRG